jgi:SH3-like domain-containing protein
MNLKTMTKSITLGLLASTLSLSPVLAAEYVSVNKDGINMRSAPNTNSEVLFQLPLGYPLEILGKEGQWLKVSDYEGDKGYIQESLTAKTPHVIVKVKECKIFAGPGPKEKVVGTGVKDVIFAKGEQKGDWIKVTHPSLSGWVHKNSVWP